MLLNKVHFSGSIFGIFLLCIPLFSTPKKQAEWKLEGKSISLTLNAEKGLIISEIQSPSMNFKIPMDQHSIPLYQVELVVGSKRKVIDATKVKDIEVLENSKSRIKLKCIHPQEGLTATVTAELNGEQNAVLFYFSGSLSQENSRFGLVRYPNFPTKVAKDEDFDLVLPLADGQIRSNILTHFKDGQRKEYPYPGLVSAQMLAGMTQQKGALVFARDAQGNYKQIEVLRSGKNVVYTFQNILYHDKSNSVSIPYPLQVSLFDQGWQSAARIYKKWAIQQSWSQRLLEKKLTQIPILKAPFVLGVNLMTPGSKGEPLSQYSAIPRVVQSWSDALGTPVTALLLSWEKNGPWVAPDYFPPFGGEKEFTQLIKNLQNNQHQTMAYLSGLNITVHKTPRHGAKTYRLGQDKIKKWMSEVIVGLDQKPRLIGNPLQGVGQYAVFCPYTKTGQDQLLSDAHKLAGYGINTIQIDQIVGGGLPPCLEEGHGHPPIGGSTQYEAIKKILSQLKEKLSPNQIISLEEPNELYIPYVDVFHTREYMENQWPREEPGARGIPLFAFLYHEFSLGYGGDSAPLLYQNQNAEIGVFAQAMNIATGKIPGAAVWLKLISFDQVHNEQKQFMVEVAKLLQTPAFPFLFGGKIVSFQNQDFGDWWLESKDLGFTFRQKVPKVLFTIFELSNKSQLHLYINLFPEDQKINLDFKNPQKKVLWPPSLTMDSERYTLKKYGLLAVQVLPK